MRYHLIDQVLRWEPPELADAVKNITMSEDFFTDHFPGHPIMPGSLIVEGLAQVAGLLLETARLDLEPVEGPAQPKAVLSVLERTRFREMARPGDRLIYRAECASVTTDGGKARVKAWCLPASATYDEATLNATRPTVETAMTFAFLMVDDPILLEERARLKKVWMREDF